MKTTILYCVIVCTVFILGLGAGWLTGTKAPSESVVNQDQIGFLKQELESKTHEITVLKETVSKLTEVANQTVEYEIEENVVSDETQSDSLTAIENEEISIEAASQETTQTLNALQRMTDNPATFNDELAQALQQQLYNKLDTDPMATRQVLDVFMSAPNSEMGQMLSSVLGLFKDAEIEDVAMQLASNGLNADQRIAGLSLLQRLDIENQASRQVVLNIIESETNSEVLNAALYTLKPSVVSAQESQTILNTLQRHLSSNNSETRRRSVIAYANWATNAAATQPIVNALFDDSVDVRAGAAFALGRSKHRSATIRDALIGKISDASEDWSVRDQAWQAVQEFEMDDHSHRVFIEFKQKRELAAEGGSG